MLLQQRINAFAQLRNHLHFDEDFLITVQQHNPWFTTDYVNIAINNISKYYLDEIELFDWCSKYPISDGFTNKKIGLIAAGNIPLVAFHDILCILISGHTLLLKLSEKDSILTKKILEKLVLIAPQFEDKIIFTERLHDFDAVIATGSNNSGRYFEYYFGKYKHIIRKNRNSLAVLHGAETLTQLEHLADDIFLYFGLGCRNVSMLKLPKGYDFNPLLKALKKYEHIIHHHSYKGNLDYYRTLHLMNRIPMIDIDFVNITENESLLCAISDLHFSFYDNLEEVKDFIDLHENNIQCIVSDITTIENRLDFGDAQKPNLRTYADNIDTMKFLTTI